MTVYFLGGATGSGLSALLYASHGWAGVCAGRRRVPDGRAAAVAGRHRAPAVPGPRGPSRRLSAQTGPGAQPLLGELGLRRRAGCAPARRPSPRSGRRSAARSPSPSACTANSLPPGASSQPHPSGRGHRRARDLHVDRAVVAARSGRPDRLGAFDAPGCPAPGSAPAAAASTCPGPAAAGSGRPPASAWCSSSAAPGPPRLLQPGPQVVGVDHRRVDDLGRVRERGAEVDLAGHGRKATAVRLVRGAPALQHARYLVRRGPPRAGSARPADHPAPGWPGAAAGRRADRGGRGRGDPRGRRRRASRCCCSAAARTW